MKRALAFVVVAVAVFGCTERSSAPPTGLSRVSARASVEAAVIPTAGSAEELGEQAASAPSDEAAPPSATQQEGVVLPNAYTNMMGESNNTFPHAFANMRYQQVFLGSELGTVRAVGGFCLRKDQFFGGPQGTQQLTVKMGPTALNHLTLTPVFDANYSASPVQVFSGTVTIPASSGGGTPGDFFFCVEYTRPYLHPAGLNVIIEIVNTSASSLFHFDDFCRGNPVCTTRRVFAVPATATAGTLDATPAGLVMKFLAANPRDKDDCKDGGWESFGFRNQGQCVRFVETGKDDRIGE